MKQMIPTARYGIVSVAVIVSMIAVVAVARAQQQAPTADTAYIAKVMGAAPEPIVKSATILAMDKGGAMRTVQKGTNDFTCMMMPGDTPMCTDRGGWEWTQALMTHAMPPNKPGFMYMLAGDGGASNTDPYATAPTATNHWVKTGPHVMILGTAAKSMTGYPKTPDADPTKPYVMWAGTPYEHLMIPVK